jgi:hypothetical protein
LKNKIKPDKYFLLHTKDENNIISSWAEPVEHLLFQLKTLKCNFSFTNIENSIQIGLNMLNYFKKIGNEKHVHGKLPSKIQNSFIILFTDSCRFSNIKKVYSKNATKISLLPCSKDDLIIEPFRWDQMLLTFILGDSNESSDLFRKYTNSIGGKTIYSKDLNELQTNVEEQAIRHLGLNKINIYFEINNAKVNKLQSIELQNDPQPRICRFSHINNFSRGLIALNVDFRMFKANQILPNIKDIENQFIFDRNENINFMEKWPLPDSELLMTKSTKTLPKKKAHSCYIIANEPNYEFPLHRNDYDEYEICDSEFLIKFLENYPEFKFSSLIKKGENLTTTLPQQKPLHSNKKLTWDVYVLINNSENIISKSPFAVLKLTVPNKIILEHPDILIIDYIKNPSNELSNQIKMKLCVLPYNYKEFFKILNNMDKVKKMFYNF